MNSILTAFFGDVYVVFFEHFYNFRNLNKISLINKIGHIFNQFWAINSSNDHNKVKIDFARALFALSINEYYLTPIYYL